MDFIEKKDRHGAVYYSIKTSDFELINTPLLNKGTAFSEKEREQFKLYGLLPAGVTTIEQQRLRAYQSFKSKPNDIEKYISLRTLQDSNETLFYYLLCSHITEILPFVYTPVVGLACQNFSHIYRRPRGIFLAYPDRDKIDSILANSAFNDVKVIVVSDGERILGLGDQGAGGMGIPIGKLALYSACAGIHPSTTLPILLDTGTNNDELLHDPLYVGWRNPRIRNQEYDNFIDLFVKAIKKRFPQVVLQWEDFALQNATRLLDRYRDTLCTFNDDVQGTAAVATGTLLAAIHVTRVPLAEQRVVIAGAGSAGCGIAELIVQAMRDGGLTEQQARARIFIVDHNGLLLERMPDLLPFQQKLLKSKNDIAHWQLGNHSTVCLFDVIKNCHPTVLIGVSGQPGLFTEALIREMAAHVNRPIIMPLSNPITRSEAVPNDLVAWTNNRVVMGTGSPFDAILKNGKPFRVDQTNNVYIFPGMGLGLISVQATRVSDKLFMVAAKALAECSPAKENHEANLLPPLDKIREVSFKVAHAVAKEAIQSGLARNMSDEEARLCIEQHLWTPEYVPYRPESS
ncbi:MAG: NAD-dependent malic enzyme [Legionellales bacterium RIFCSPHIGHO2_12_FULL_42_9]|nr:MAG: NAD-dependent malic enzyme [Legionellales bacterium RIFCSPHIGHO2_12_FULL_42_9]